MNNVFLLDSTQVIQKMFDLKGSTYKRETTEKKMEKGAAGKDLNFTKNPLNKIVLP